MAVAVRAAVWGKPADLDALRPSRRGGTVPPGVYDPEADEFDEEGLADQLASFGFVEVPADD